FHLHAAGELRRLIDRRHAAVYHVRRHDGIGYLIMAPGRRPRVVEGFVSAKALAHEIGQYELLVHRVNSLDYRRGSVLPNKRLKLAGAYKEELRCLAGGPFYLRLHHLAPAGI